MYAVTGGKQGPLHTLVDEWTEAPEVGEAYRATEDAEDAAALVSTLASLARRMRRDWGDVMKTVLATAPLDEAAPKTFASIPTATAPVCMPRPSGWPTWTD